MKIQPPQNARNKDKGSLTYSVYSENTMRYHFYLKHVIVRTLREDQPLRLLLNLLFDHFNHSEATYKYQRIKLPYVIAAYNQLNVNALN